MGRGLLWRLGVAAMCVMSTAMWCGNANGQTDILLYNGGSSLVNQGIEVDLKPGVNRVSSERITKLAVPWSIRVLPRPTPGAPSLVQYKTRYYDANSYEAEVMRRYAGKTIPMRINQRGEKSRSVEARVLPVSYGGGSVWGASPSAYQWNFLVDGGVFAPYARGYDTSYSFVLPEAETREIFTAKVDVALATAKPYKGPVTLAYLTNGLAWEGRYSLVVDPARGLADINCFAVINNDTEMDFPDAQLKLVPITLTARETVSYGTSVSSSGSSAFSSGAMPQEAAEQAVSDSYRALDLPDRVDLKRNETVAIDLMTVQETPVMRIYRYTNGWYYDGSSVTPSTYDSNTGESFSGDKDIQGAWQIMNTKEAKLGRMLPNGRVAVYLKDPTGVQVYTGQSAVPTINPGDPLRVRTGAAPSTRADRNIKIQEPTEENGVRWQVSAEIKLINAGSKEIPVDVVEMFDPRLNWRVVKCDFPHEKVGFNQLVIKVPVPKEGSVSTELKFELWR